MMVSIPAPVLSAASETVQPRSEHAHEAGMAAARDRRALGRDGERVDRAADGDRAVRIGSTTSVPVMFRAAEVTPGGTAEVERAGEGARRQGLRRRCRSRGRNPGSAAASLQNCRSSS
ncbi:MAG: hypothetical protein ACLUNO_09810 [Oscillospiraceae bacterium]